jgi:hypothetical protein
MFGGQLKVSSVSGVPGFQPLTSYDSNPIRSLSSEDHLLLVLGTEEAPSPEVISGVVYLPADVLNLKYNRHD